MNGHLSSTKQLQALFFLIAAAVVCGSCSILKYPRNGIFLIPKGYVGDVIVLFDQIDGVDLETEDGLFVYRIPSNGILKVKNKAYTGVVNRHYFYVRDNGEREKIGYLRITGDRSPQGLPQNKFGDISENEFENRIYVMNAGGLGSFNTKKGVVQYTSFIVATPKHSEKGRHYNRMQDRLFVLQRELTIRASSEQQ